MTPEAKVKKEITAYLASVGAWYDAPVRTGYGRRGVPDIVVCYRGRFIALEVKAGTSVATPWQRREIAAIVAAGGVAEVVWTVEQVQAIIERVDGMFTSDELLDTIATERAKTPTVEKLPDGSYRRVPRPF